MLFVFIGGGSGSGKSEISRQLKTKLQEQGYQIISITMDNYYKERPEHISSEEYFKITNFDEPGALQLGKLRDDLRTLALGKAIQQPRYQFDTQRVSGSDTVNPDGKDVVIVEGIFALTTAEMCKDIKKYNVYVGPSMYFDMIVQREDRDTSGDRGKRTRKDIRKHESATVGPGFFQYVAHTSNYAHIHLTNKRSTSPLEGLTNCSHLASLILEKIDDLLPAKLECNEKEKDHTSKP